MHVRHRIAGELTAREAGYGQSIILDSSSDKAAPTSAIVSGISQGLGERVGHGW